MTKFIELVTAYSRLTAAELESYLELRHLLETEQVRAILFIKSRNISVERKTP
jgi:hypothetical protein